MRRPLVRTLLLPGALIGAILGYGYWHALTHAAYYVDLKIVTDPAEGASPCRAPR